MILLRTLRAFVLFVVLSGWPEHVAAAGRLSIVDAAYVTQAMSRGAIVWDVRAAADYDKGHLPRAVNIDHVSRALLDEKTQLFLPTEHIARRLGDAGIDPRKPIIVYGVHGSSYAYFALFALESFGVRDVRIYHEGIDGWRAARRPVSTRAVGKAPVRVKLTERPAFAATTEEVRASLGNPAVQFVDVRREAEWTGQEKETLHGGHLPGAIHIPYDANYVDPEAPAKLFRKEITDTSGMALKPERELAALYARLDPAKEIIVYCHTGIRSALTVAVLARLGFRNVRNYHASWFDYGNRHDARVEK